MGIAAAMLATLLAANPVAAPAAPSLMHGASGGAIFNGRSVNIPRTLDRLQQAHVTTYLYEIYGGHADRQWSELPTFLDQAAQRGIKVMVYLFPPAESGGGNYPPFGFDYPRWASQLAALSLTHPALTGFAIDDFGENSRVFTPTYARQIVQAARAQNPNFQFWPVFYYRELVGKHAIIRRYNASIFSGVIFPFRDEPAYDTSVSKTVPAQIMHVRNALKPYQRLAVTVYARHYSRQVNKGNPGPDYVGAVTQDALSLGASGYDDGVIVYDMNLTGQDDTYSLAGDYDRVSAIYGGNA
ncbi:MAG TPA: hypothetical protein VL551_18140 [Actinospica sp.]|jgi:hypothetical protein|nr:hypothetical protein [Actinospica sp.]